MNHLSPRDPDELTSRSRDYPVLYVDDEAENLLVFSAAFGERFEIIQARSAAQAMSILAARKVAVLVTDQRMPGMTGIELCERVRQSHPRTRRMLMTAYSDHQTAIEAINRGRVHAYIEKPWVPEEVLHALGESVQRVYLEETVDALREGMEEKNRLLTLARMRDRLLHDIAGVTSRLELSTRSLRRLLTKRRPELPEDFATRAARDVTSLERAVDHMVQLHHQRHAASGDDVRIEAHGTREILETLRTLTDMVEVSPENEDVPVLCDRLSVIRILLNLVRNAHEAMDQSGERGSVTVSARDDGEEVVFDVQDDGPGVPVSVRPRIFDEHFSTKKERGGTGIGLASSRVLAEANHGTLELPDGQPERGALFRLRLRAARSRPGNDPPLHAGGDAR